MNFKKLIIVGATVALAAASMAQGFRGGFGRGMGNNPTFLLRSPDVQTDLQLTDEQKTKLQELQQNTMQSMRDAFQNSNGDRDAAQKAAGEIMQKASDETNKILTADQQKRLKEINIQINGLTMLGSDKDLQDAVALTDDQKTKIAALNKTAQDANQAVFQKAQNGEIDRSEVGPTIQKNNQTLKDETNKVLTDDQKAKLKTLGGKPFTGQIQPFGRGGGR